MSIHKGQRVKTLSKKVGQSAREGVVITVHGDTVEVKWDDGHMSTLSGGVLVPVKKAGEAAKR